MSTAANASQVDANDLQHMVSKAGGVGSLALWISRNGARRMERSGDTYPAVGAFPLGSVSKFVTAIALLAGQRHGDVSLDWPLAHVDDCIPRYGGARVRLTVEDVLRHRTGLSTWSFAGSLRDQANLSLAEVLQGRGPDRPLVFEHIPLSRTAYSSGAFGLLELEVSRRLGAPVSQWLPEFLRRVEPESQIATDEAHCSGGVSAAQGYLHASIQVPGGSLRQQAALSQGLWGSGKDLIRLIETVGHHVRSGDYLSAVTQLRGHARMALSVLVTGSGSRLRLSHQGYVPGFNAQFISEPHQDVHGVLMTNAPVAASDLDRRLENALTGPAITSRAPAAPPPAAGQHLSDEQFTVTTNHHEATLHMAGVESIALVWDGYTYAGPDGGYPRVHIAPGGGTLEDGRGSWALVRSGER